MFKPVDPKFVTSDGEEDGDGHGGLHQGFEEDTRVGPPMYGSTHEQDHDQERQ